jgi:hypothetical protein
MNNQSDWLNRANYTAEERRHMCVQLLSEAQYWDVHQYLKMMSDSTKRPWVDLSDEEVDALHMAVKVRLMGTFDIKEIYRTIEAKLKEKNT